MTIDINGDIVTQVTIDGEFVEQITADGDVVFDGIFDNPQQIQQLGLPNGYYPIKTSTGSSEFYVNTEDHSDGGWILASNFDASDGNFANEYGYNSPSSYNLPGTSGSVTSNYNNYEGSSSLSEGPYEMTTISNNGDDQVTFESGSFGTAESGSDGGLYMTYKTFRPETNDYQWNEIKFRCVYTGGNDAYQNSNESYSSRSGSDYDLFANSSDGGKLLAGEPNNNAEHIAEIGAAGGTTSDRSYNQLNYSPRNLLFEDINSDGKHVNQFITNEITQNMNNTQTAPPCLTLHTDEPALNERSVYEKWYIWIR